MSPLDDRGPPQQMYRDDDATSVHSNASDASDTILVGRSEASQEDEYYSFANNKYIPPRLHRAWRKTVIWVKGPQPPRPWKIHPWFPRVQTAPIRFLNNYFPKRRHKIALLVFFYLSWLLSFGLVLHRSAFAADIPGYGSPVRIRCSDRFW